MQPASDAGAQADRAALRPPGRGAAFAPAPGNALRQARTAAGYTLSSFASAMAVSVACASRWETNVRRPHSDDLRRIADLVAADRAAVDAWFGAPVLATEGLRDARGLRPLRLRAGMSRAQLAASAGVSVASVAHWECGRRSLPARRWPAVAAAVGLPVPAFLAAVQSAGSSRVPARPLVVLRRRTGLTQNEVAARLGVSGALVSRWERGVLVPSWPNTRRLALLLGMPLAFVARAAGRTAPKHLDRSRWRRDALGPVLHEIRLWRGESRASLALRVRVHDQTLRRWEAGASTPPHEKLDQLEAALGLPRGTLPRSG